MLQGIRIVAWVAALGVGDMNIGWNMGGRQDLVGFYRCPLLREIVFEEGSRLATIFRFDNSPSIEATEVPAPVAGGQPESSYAPQTCRDMLRRLRPSS
jgi:hypothetical protein